jgi:hypothetical protein
MKLRRTRYRLAAAVVTTAVAGALAVAASPASAKVSDGYITGGGDISNDWGDEGEVSQSSHAKSNATCLWQQILWAEGVKKPDGKLYSAADVDGQFGANTAYATKKLQSRWGLSADGRAGNNTWGHADSKLRFFDYATEYSFGGKILTYEGSARSFYLARTERGSYVFWEGSTNDNGKLRYAAYTYTNCT